MNMKKTMLMLLCLAMVLTMIACGKKNQVEETTEGAEETTAAEATTAANETIGVLNPISETEALPAGYMRSYMTGEVVSEEIGTRRPVAFQIDNEKIAQPQNGVAQAEVVYEVPIEAYEVRLTAIFQDFGTVERIGALRSARKYHPGIVAEYDAIFFHNGHSKYAVANLDDERCDDLEGIENSGWPALIKAEDHKNGHNDFTTPEKTLARIEKLGFRTTVSEDFTYKFLFAKDDQPNMLEGGITANKVSTNFKQNKSYFEYDEKSGTYLRYAYGTAHVDQDNDQQVAVKNILVQYTTYKLESDKDNKDIKTVGTGTGVFITNGKAVNITWEKESYWENTHYYYENGEEIVLNQGKTWVAIVLPKLTGEITIE